MSEVNYIASTSTALESEPSVEIVDPKVNSTSLSFSDELESIKDDNRADTDTDKLNRPSGALWRQQKLPAWQPILTSDTVLPAFFLLAITLIPIGAGLLISSNYVKEIKIEYTDCQMEGKKCSDLIHPHTKDINVKCQCWVDFTLKEDFNAPVFFYYGLTKYYQNHRRYVQSRHDGQLAGKDIDVKGSNGLDSACWPYGKDNASRPIAPCGIIANSFFNDTFQLYMVISPNSNERIDLLETDIAWPTDKEAKYKNPRPEVFAKSSHPPYWRRYVNDLDPYHPDNNGYKNEHLMVWLRTAAFPSFRKIWARIDHDQNILWRTKLPKGDYKVLVNYNYPVIHKTKSGSWEGHKYIYLSNTSWLGGKNDFLGIAYITVGGICLMLWIAFLIIVKKFGQKPKDIVEIGPKTPFIFTKPKPKVSNDSATQPLNRSVHTSND